MRRAVRRTIPVIGAALVLTLAGVAATAEPAGHATVCHRTGSSVNPFVTIHPSVNGAFHGHLNHAGDVIPPFEYQGQTYSLNWPSDEVEIVDGECALRAEEPPIPEEPPTPEEPPEVEPTPPIVSTPPFTG